MNISEVSLQVGMCEVVLILLFAYLTKIGAWRCKFYVILIYCLFSIKKEFQISFNFFFELKLLKGLVLLVIFLEYDEKGTLSAGIKKAGVKNNLSLLKVGMMLSIFPLDLNLRMGTFLAIRSLFQLGIDCPLC